jgi:hypothetical protein
MAVRLTEVASPYMRLNQVIRLQFLICFYYRAAVYSRVSASERSEGSLYPAERVPAMIKALILFLICR